MRTVFRSGHIVSGAALLALSLPLFALAQNYQPLSAIPGVTSGTPTLASYISALFLISISIGALLAVIKIAIGGVQYMMSDVVTTKQDAKATITGALLGLGILLATVVVLYTIDPRLLSLEVLTGADPVQIQSISSGSGSGGTGGQNDTQEPQPGDTVIACPDGLAASSAKAQCESVILPGPCSLFGRSGTFHPGDSTTVTKNAKCIFSPTSPTAPDPEPGETSETISCIGDEFGMFDCTEAIQTCEEKDENARYEEGDGFITCYYPSDGGGGGGGSGF